MAMNIKRLTFISMLFATVAYSAPISEFKTDLPEFIGTWEFEANPAGKQFSYQMAIWAPKEFTYSDSPQGVLTWLTCRTAIRVNAISKSLLPQYNLTDDQDLLDRFDFFKLSEEFIFKIGYCSNEKGDQWPGYILRDPETAEMYAAGRTIDTQQIEELEASMVTYKREASQREWEKSKAGMDRGESLKIYMEEVREFNKNANKKIGELKAAPIRVYSKIRRSRPDNYLAPAIKHAETHLGLTDEIAHVREILNDPSAKYGQSYIASRQKQELGQYLPHQPTGVVSVSANRWEDIENGGMYSEIANGTFKGYGPGEAYHYYEGYISLIRGYSNYCEETINRGPAVSVNYDWVERDGWGEKSREQHFNKPILMRERYAKSFDTAWRQSQKSINVMGMLKGGVGAAMQIGLDRVETQERMLRDAFKLVESEDCNSTITIQLLENYHRKMTDNSPYIQEVDERTKAL